ncbi:excalibur calcium-binding domain-containing protein [Kocuria sp. M1R5S2]|uniref:excalibur calcium-binding domain-containing protein n=1 Tax=Kocuria rhizosphaerae TaxID=3376285 RepID=UPI00379FD3FF
MNKHTAGAALAVAVGLSALTVVPATAATGDPMVFTDCATAAGYGVHNIPVGSPSYSAGLLDEDGDGVVCEDAQWPYDPTRIPVEVAPGEYRHTIIDWVPGAGPGTDGFSQVGQVPVGGADTGVAVDEGVSGPVLGGLGLLAAAGAAVALRRRTAGRA